MRGFRRVAIALLVLSACGRPGPASSPALPASSAPALASAAPPSSSADADDAGAPVAAAASPFHLVATGSDLQLFTLGSDTFVTEGCSQGGPFASARLTPAGIELTNALTEGWSYCVLCYCNFQGSYPEHVFREAPWSEPDGCTTQELQVKRGSKWVAVGGPGGGEILVGEWSKGRRVAAAQSCGGDLGLAVLDAKDRIIRPKDAPALTRVLMPHGVPAGELKGFASFPSGEVLLLLGPIGDTPARLGVWRDGKPVPSVYAVPAAAGELGTASFVALGPADTLLGVQTEEGPMLLGFDGATWSELPVSGPKRIDVMRAARDGGVWVAGTDPTLWHRSPGGAWSAMRLPDGVTVMDVAEPRASDVFVVSPRALYRNRDAAAVRFETDCPDAVANASDYDLARCKPRLVPPSP
jgi:hypothetical protein